VRAGPVQQEQHLKRGRATANKGGYDHNNNSGEISPSEDARLRGRAACAKILSNHWPDCAGQREMMQMQLASDGLIAMPATSSPNSQKDRVT
jgi:hypothetical protein